MNIKSSLLYKTLVVCIILLFIGISVQPCIAIVQKEDRLDSKSEPTGPINDAKWFATLRMDIGDEIYNEKIDWREKSRNPVDHYYINVSINFRCPPNRKIEIKYYYCAVFISDDGWIKFFDYESSVDSVTIINGSNPPDINENVTKYCYPAGMPGHFVMSLIIACNITVYKYENGEWVSVDEDSIYLKKYDRINFYYAEKGFIICLTLKRFGNFFCIPRPFVRVRCKDLNTLLVRGGKTRFLGFYIFKFLPQGHDYELRVSPKGVSEESITITNLGKYAIVRLYINNTT